MGLSAVHSWDCPALPKQQLSLLTTLQVVVCTSPGMFYVGCAAVRASLSGRQAGDRSQLWLRPTAQVAGNVGHSECWCVQKLYLFYCIAYIYSYRHSLRLHVLLI